MKPMNTDMLDSDTSKRCNSGLRSFECTIKKLANTLQYVFINGLDVAIFVYIKYSFNCFHIFVGVFPKSPKVRLGIVEFNHGI